MKPLEIYKNFPLKNVLSLIIEYTKCTSSFFRNLAASVGSKTLQNKPSALIRREENKVEFLERPSQSEKLSLVHKKETEHSFELSLSICAFYWFVFNLEKTH